MDCSPPGSSIHGILQAWILEWVVMPSSRGSSQPRDRNQVPLKLSSFAKLMINLSIQNVIPFLVQHLFPSRLRSSKKGGWNWAGLCGTQGHKSTSVSPISCLEEKVFSLLDLPWIPKGQMQIITNQSEGIQKQRKGNNSAAMEQLPGSSSRDIHNNQIHFWVILQELGDPPPPTHTLTPTRGWWLQIVHKPMAFRLAGTRILMIDIPGTPSCNFPTNQSEECHISCRLPTAPPAPNPRFYL